MLKDNELPQDSEAFVATYSHPVTQSSCRVALRNFQRFAEWAGLTAPDAPLNPARLRRESLAEYVAWMRRRRYSQPTIERHLAIVGRYLDGAVKRTLAVEMWTALAQKSGTFRRRARPPMPAGSKSLLVGYAGHTLRSYRGALLTLQVFAEQTGRTALGVPVKPKVLRGDAMQRYRAWLKRRGCRPTTIERHLYLAARYLNID